MNILTTVLLASSLLLTATAAAQGPGAGQGYGRGPGGGRGYGMAGLDLSAEQRTKCEDLRLKHLKEITPLRADLEKQRSALALEVTAEKYSEANVKAIQGEISKIQTTIALKGIAHRRAIRDMLTPEQQKTFDARMLEPGRGKGRGPGNQGWGRGGRGHRYGECPGCWR